VNPEEQFTEYLDSHKNLILKVASIYCFNAEERKDLIQEIILQLWKSFSNYNSTSKFSTWAYRISLNVSISYVRKTYVRNRALEEYKEFVKVGTPEGIQSSEKLDKLFKALEILKPIERAIITLNLDGCRTKEIAEIIGTTRSNVSTRLFRIKNKLKNHLNT